MLEKFAVPVGVLLLSGLAVVIYILGRKKKEADRKITENRYREQMFELLFQTVDDIFVMIGSDAQSPEYISPNVERLFGVSVHEVTADVGILQRAAVQPDGMTLQEQLKRIPPEGCVEREREYVHFSTGEQRRIHETFYHVRIQGEDKYVLMFSDRTMESRMNESLRAALDSARSANEAKSHFLSNMSHDIRTPMNAIMGFAMLLSKENDNPERIREYTGKIIHSSRHLLGLINDVLDMSKIESGKTSLNIEEFGMPELLEELCGVMLPQAKARKQTFEIHICGKVPELLLGDRLRVNQIFLNLLTNAVRYTPEGGHIECQVKMMEQTSLQNARLCFVVKDNGIGMSEAFQETVFEPFTREISSVTNKIQGTGLGLAITKNIVDLMGGTIAVRSSVGEGSTFTVELEFALPKRYKDEKFWREHGISRMLVVDENESTCLVIREQMADTGILVEYAQNGAAAEQKVREAHLRQEDFQIILLDFNMPEEDVATVRKIRLQDIGASTFLLLTDYDTGVAEEAEEQAGVDGFLSKPFFVSKFRQAVSGLAAAKEKKERCAGAGSDAAWLSAAGLAGGGKKEKGSLAGMLFLAAEDNELNAEILMEMLRMEGAACELVENGLEAVERFCRSGQGYYDMILMDIQMPVMGGYEAARRIRGSSHPDAEAVPIVAMTANAFAEDVRDAMEAGMNAHIAKPMDMAVLKSTLKKLGNQR